jgi:hypothetical protein
MPGTARTHLPVERRRSLRVSPDGGLPVRLATGGSSWLTNVSLGGATLVSERKLDRFDTLRIEYGSGRADVRVQVYRSVVNELYYANGQSRVRYRSRVIFRDASIEALNTLYRIIYDNWSPLDSWVA